MMLLVTCIQTVIAWPEIYRVAYWLDTAFLRQRVRPVGFNVSPFSDFVSLFIDFESARRGAPHFTGQHRDRKDLISFPSQRH